MSNLLNALSTIAAEALYANFERQSKVEIPARKDMLPCRWTVRPAGATTTETGTDEDNVINEPYLHVQVETILERQTDDETGELLNVTGGNRSWGFAFDVPFSQFQFVETKVLTPAEMRAVVLASADGATKSLSSSKTYNTGWLRLMRIPIDRNLGFVAIFTDPNTENHELPWQFISSVDTRLEEQGLWNFCKAEVARCEERAREEEVQDELREQRLTQPTTDEEAAASTCKSCPISASCHSNEAAANDQQANDESNDGCDEEPAVESDYKSHEDVPDDEVADPATDE